MYLVLCYDVVTNRDRTRLFKTLQNYLTAVQKSVFEGELPAHRYESLRRDVLRCINRETDTVRIYQLCARCSPAKELLGTSRTVSGPEDIVV